jgi:hypothetical protein
MEDKVEVKVKVKAVFAKLDGKSSQFYSCSIHGIGITGLKEENVCQRDKSRLMYCKTWNYYVLACEDHAEYFTKLGFITEEN